MGVSGLIDTGAILALLRRSDWWHAACVEALRQIRLPLLTSEGVLTELFYMVGPGRDDLEAAWRFVRSGALVIGAIDDSSLSRIHELMSTYADCPMDFADATLVYLAERESLTTIFTVDRSDFETYRIGGKRRFRILPVKEA